MHNRDYEPGTLVQYETAGVKFKGRVDAILTIIRDPGLQGMLPSVSYKYEVNWQSPREDGKPAQYSRSTETEGSMGQYQRVSWTGAEL